MSSSSDKPSTRLCEQRKFNGDPCKSPAKSGKRFCHFHEVSGTPPIDINNSETIPSTHVYLPPLEDAASIQSAISEVCELMLHRRIEPKEASSLFYAMQVASVNLGFMNAYRTPGLNSENSPDTSSEPKALPPGTIQACEQPQPRTRRRSA